MNRKRIGRTQAGGPIRILNVVDEHRRVARSPLRSPIRRLRLVRGLLNGTMGDELPNGNQFDSLPAGMGST